ncbi:MAG: GNAT family N-acetyltransferase [Actinomycetes bacterium]|jgi:GNAT superfamily N-acetyltransferase|nr:GNAT family N-acetyltransferase [Actinomycetes bacterium]
MRSRVRISMYGKDVLELANELAAIYRAAFGAPGYNEPPEAAERFRTEQLPGHADRTGFRCVVARLDGRVVGFAYGHTGEFGQWWTDWVASRAPVEVVAEWLGGHFEFVELAVDPLVQGSGIGQALHDRLLAGLPHRRAVLATYRDDRAAPRLYRRSGWRLLMPGLDASSDLYGLELPYDRAKSPR